MAVGSHAVGQTLPPQARYSTHDQTVPAAGEGGDFREWGADTKSPGDGRTYSVLTIEVRQTDPIFPAPTALFSGAAVSAPSPIVPFTLATGARQVVLLQVIDNADQSIVWQRFFYGSTPEVLDRATNARGVSVWPAANQQDTRIAICGETYDQVMPSSQAPAGWPSASSTRASGFIAVFNGLGDLLWTHHFFGGSQVGNCAITDVSIRVGMDPVGDPLTDFVTFCGISSHGNPATGNAWLTPIQPFAAPAGTLLCSNPAGGATHNGSFGVSQWDGIVGRLSRPHSPPGTTATDFLSIVGGNQQDGLFGIAEIDERRFVAVGSSGIGAASGSGTATLPLTSPLPAGNTMCLSLAATPYAMGVVMVFNAVNVATGPLQLEWSLPVCSERALGGGISVPDDSSTVCRDVLVLDYLPGKRAVNVVGSTDDANLSSAPLVPMGPPQFLFGGGTDGLIVTYFDEPLAAPPFVPFGPSVATYRGGAGLDGLTGTNGWNEFPDQFVVTGFTEGGAGFDIEVASYLNVGVFAELTQPPFPNTSGLPAGARIGGSGTDLPTAMGAIRATNSFAFSEFGLGDPAGGGIAVDSSARVNVVGGTASSDYAVTPAAVFAAGRPKLGAANDAVRTVFDMLPLNVGRTDGTGAVPTGTPFPLPGVFGGTTPECALLPFGRQIGITPPANALPRMLIDYAGLGPASGATVTLIVSRPPATTSVLGTVLQFDFPGAGAPGPILFLPDGVVFWNTNSTAVVFPQLPPPGFPVGLHVFPLSTLPAPPPPAISLTISAQVCCLLGVPVAGGSFGPTCPGGGQSFTANSPALFFSY